MPPNRLKPPEKPEGVALLNRLFLTQYQMRLLTLFGGMPGWRDPLILEQALELAHDAAHRGPDASPIEVAAIYGLELSKGAFVDANVRLAAIAMATTLRLNELELNAPDEALVSTLRAMEAGTLELPELVNWLQKYVKPIAF